MRCERVEGANNAADFALTALRSLETDDVFRYGVRCRFLDHPDDDLRALHLWPDLGVGLDGSTPTWVGLPRAHSG